jgi:hypothetical protein
MAKVTLELPDDVAAQLQVMLKRLEATTKAAQAADGTPFDANAALGAITEATTAVSLELKRRVLQGLDLEAQRVRIGDQPHTKVGRYEASYKTLEGEVTVTRNLYRADGMRNGKTVDLISARLGAIEGGWLPETATAMAFLLAQGTSREAEATARTLKRLPYSRCSFERVGHMVGAMHDVMRTEVESVLIERFVLPEGAHSVSVSIDRVAMPMEEPRAKPKGKPKKGAAKRPVSFVYRMAYCGTVTVHDADGRGLHTIRYGRMPKSDAKALSASLATDVAALHAKKPGLKLSILTDGAPELHSLLDNALAVELPGVTVYRLVDFWHLIEKLGQAAALIHGPAEVARWKLSLLNSRHATGRIIQALESSRCASLKVGDARPVGDALRYLRNHRERMNYADARALGLPIGSGNVEATCKSLVSIRFRRPGARWKEVSGHHVLDLRALALSDRFHEAVAGLDRLLSMRGLERQEGRDQ